MTFRVELKKVVDDSYDLEIGRSLADKCVLDIKNGVIFQGIRRIAVVTDSNVHDLYARQIADKLKAAGFEVHMITIPAGEESKTRQMKEYVEDSMLQAGLRRDCAVLAVGGGVVTDLAGFTAGTFGRGVPFANYATTLLAAADASVGGKTAVDTPLATNLIGMFNQPKKVYIDIDCWKTLDQRQLSSGLAETIKHGCLGDKELFDFLEKNIEGIFEGDPQACQYIAEHNCAVKYDIVIRDEREASLREVLNLGHTVGRAIETLSGYRLLHGEAVAIGMAAQVRLGNKLGYISENNMNRVISLYKAARLPVDIPDYVDADELVKKLYTDKKVKNGRLRFVFQNEIGSVVEFENGKYSRDIEESQIAEILKQMKGKD